MANGIRDFPEGWGRTGVAPIENGEGTGRIEAEDKEEI